MGCLSVILFIISVATLISFATNPTLLLAQAHATYKFWGAILMTIVSSIYFIWIFSSKKYDELSYKLKNEYGKKLRSIESDRKNLIKEYDNLSIKLTNDHKKKLVRLEQVSNDLAQEYSLKHDKLRDKEIKLKELVSSKTPFNRSASLIADINSVFFDECSHFLEYKPHPAYTAAQEVQRVKRLASDYLQQYKEMQYKYEYILSAFPEITEYVEDESELIDIGETFSMNDIDEIRDKTRDYLTSEEWSSLSISERNQLALDRYIKKQKTPWQIGRDYELCCAYHLELNDYKVVLHGILRGVHDLGRDLIAVKQHSSFCEHLIIQCKCWNSQREIRENVVFQLYGTYIAYELELRSTNNSLFKDEISCVLMIPSFSKLTPVAEAFCKRLNIQIWTLDYDNFPRIKCNINKGMKIYHLPFDQQYDRVQIKNEGECMVATVSEAEALGFRRALRHVF